LITITGGKWTTYRSMAAAAVDRAAAVGGLPARECRTAALRIGGVAPPDGVPVLDADVRRAIRDEMARTIEDVLARRLGTLFVDARAAAAAAGEVAAAFKQELGRDATWARAQILAFRERARECLPNGAADW
jgi:glycerol-3-phosphate dehydrogenase